MADLKLNNRVADPHNILNRDPIAVARAALGGANAAGAAGGPAPVDAQPAMVGAGRARAMEHMLGVNPGPQIVDPTTYDYVFVGAGPTGGLAAADLSALFEQVESLRAKGFKVLVLEGGVDKDVDITKIPAGHGLASEHPDVLADPARKGRGTGYWVRHYPGQDAYSDDKANKDGLIWKPRGAGFGGSTRMNAMVFIRVDDSDWEKRALDTGDPAFRAPHMKKIFELLTKTEYQPVLKLLNELGEGLGLEFLKDIAGHGFSGQLEITRADPRLLLEDRQIKEMAIKSLNWAATNLGSLREKAARALSKFDPNDDRTQGTEGAVLMPTTIDTKGRRSGARGILLNAAEKHKDTLTLQDGSRVERVVLDDQNRAKGVVYVDQQGKEHLVRCNNEVIIAAGAMETVPLLNRSGIGSQKALGLLEKYGVEPKVVLEGVGQHQGDRREIGMVYELKKPLDLVERIKLDDKASEVYQKWAEGRGGPLASNGPFFSMQVKSRPDLKDPDLYIFAVPGDFEGYWNGQDNSVKLPPGEEKKGYAEHALAAKQKITFLVLDANKGNNNGTIEINPNDPLGPPIVDHHFEMDNGNPAIIHGIRTVREMVADTFADLVKEETWPGKDSVTDEQLQQKINSQKWGHHPRGGAQMGHANDPNTVVDTNFKVLGTTGLRVIDASMLPDNIGTFIVSGLYQVGKLAALKIADEAQDGPKPAAKFNPLSIRCAPEPENLQQAQATTKKAADDAIQAGMISPKQYERLTDGTVSKLDVEVAWAAISEVLHGPNKDIIGGDRHTLAHNLLLAVSRQMEKQDKDETERETRGDKFSSQFDGIRGRVGGLFHR